MPSDVYFNLKSDKQTKIINSAIIEFTSFPFDEVQVKRIVEAAGIARGSFYQYFEDIADLFKYILTYIRSEIISGTFENSSFNTSKDLIENIRFYFEMTAINPISEAIMSNEQKLLNQIRKSQKAIEIFIDQFGNLSQITHQLLNNYIKQNSEQERIFILDLVEIIIPALKITLEKLLNERITRTEAINEMNRKLDIISSGCKK